MHLTSPTLPQSAKKVGAISLSVIIFWTEKAVLASSIAIHLRIPFLLLIELIFVFLSD